MPGGAELRSPHPLPASRSSRQPRLRLLASCPAAPIPAPAAGIEIIAAALTSITPPNRLTASGGEQAFALSVLVFDF